MGVTHQSEAAFPNGLRAKGLRNWEHKRLAQVPQSRTGTVQPTSMHTVQAVQYQCRRCLQLGTVAGQPLSPQNVGKDEMQVSTNINAHQHMVCLCCG